MKKFSQIFESASKKSKLNIQDNTINYVNAKELKEYLEITDKFISDEAKEIVKYLIDNNDSYIDDLSGNTKENALAYFYDNATPASLSEEKKKLYKNIGLLVKKDRLMEIPVFLTKEQFEAIVNKTESPDAIILDLTSERGRNEIAKKYQPLIHKIARQLHGKTNLSYDDLISAGNQGLVYAMNGYGKKTDKNLADLETIVSKTFTQYAAFIIRTNMIGDVRDVSQTVRVPISQQRKEKEEKGYNTKSNSVSGDKSVSNNGEEGNKSLFDFISGSEDASRGIDYEDMEKLWKKFYSKLEEKFDKTTLDIWYSSFGLNGREKMKKKEIAEKYDIVPSNVTYYIYKVNNFIHSDKQMKSMLSDINELMAECKHDLDQDYDPEEGLHINIKDNNEE